MDEQTSPFQMMTGMLTLATIWLSTKEITTTLFIFSFYLCSGGLLFTYWNLVSGLKACMLGLENGMDLKINPRVFTYNLDFFSPLNLVYVGAMAYSGHLVMGVLHFLVFSLYMESHIKLEAELAKK